MKRSFVIVTFLLFCTTLNASSITIVAEDAGSGILRIGYQITEVTRSPVCFSLDLSLDNNATFESIIYANPAFPIYPGSVTIDPAGVITDYGSPVAPADDIGAVGQLGDSAITIEMGVPLVPHQVDLEFPEPRDINFDGLVDNMDMAVFVDDWLEDMAKFTDLNHDGFVNFADYAILVDPAPPVPMSGVLLLLQLSGNPQTSTNVFLTDNLYRGCYLNDGSPFDVSERISVVIPEPAMILLLTLGGIILRKSR